MLATVLLLGLVLIASITDLCQHKIYNWTTYPGLLLALGLNAIGCLLSTRSGVGEAGLGWLGWPGWAGFRPWESLLGLAACGGVMLLCFVLFRIGGGDVKLIAMLGAFLGLEKGIEAMLWTFVLGGCMALILLVWRVGPLAVIGRVFRHLVWTLRLAHWQPLTAGERAQLQPPLFLAPSALAAVVIVRFGLMEYL